MSKDKDKDKDKHYLTKRSKDSARWYTDVILASSLADYGPARGTMVIKPYGYAIWENIQRDFDRAIKKLGVKNAYFPLFIPMNLLQKEKTHVEGFSPELAVVTHGGGKKLAEPLAVRPTSETIMYEMYSKWISSWRDLPLKINQWNNVVRWEKRTYFFLRTLEFLWQEGHTAHATHEEAEEMTLAALDEYEKLYKNTFAIAGWVGVKSESERFAGADTTYSIEVLAQGGKALQAATSHNLGQNFAKPFDISFQDKEGETKYVHQTSWGLSTRSIGGLILVHGDDDGLILPPRLAPTKAVIIPVLGEKDAEVLQSCFEVKQDLEQGRSVFPGEIEVWDDAEKSFGWKINEAEIKGIPIRIEIGPKEVKSRTINLTFRLQEMAEEKVSLSKAKEEVEKYLAEIQEKMYQKSKASLKENTRQADNYEDFKKIIKDKRGFVEAFWCQDPDCEEKIKAETKATTRVKLLGAKKQKGNCIYCRREANYSWLFAQAY